MVRILIAVALLAAVATSLATEPAQAQLDWLFGRPPPPPRPPRDLPDPSPAPGQQDVAPQRLPPPPSSQPRQSPPPRAVRRAPAIRTQPLPPPPGTAPSANAPAQPGQPARPAQPQQAQPTPPAQTPPATGPQQANVAPQPDEVTVTEVPTQKIVNKRAVFSGLDKITGRIISFDVAIDETVQFGALQVTPKACYTRPPTESANTDAFVQVDEVTLQGEVRRIFTGWMFAASPGLHAVEHPIYDVWLTDCKSPETPVAEVQQPEPKKPPPSRHRGSRRRTPRR